MPQISTLARAPDWPYYPVFFRLREQPVLLLGGGVVAARKLRLLLRAGARVQIVARALNPELSQICATARARWLGSSFDPRQLSGCVLVIAATDDADLNQRVATAAQAAGIPVNVVDDAQRSTFITPAVVDRAPLLVAVSSSGTAPVLARRVRERIEALLPAQYGQVARFIGAQRRALRGHLDAGRQRRLWEQFLDSPAIAPLMAGDTARAQQTVDALQQQTSAAQGEVYLVGAGPGDPDLLTLKALRLMQQCDVVLYDRLVAPAILELVRRDAARVFVGKARNHHALPQDQINTELVRLAQQGQRVLRLKGGDPFIFGRGGEEIETLMAQGVAFQVVPGVTAASGCAAYAGIPLTHRDYAQTCLFITGHARADGTLKLPWQQLAQRGQTVVVYMGLLTLPMVCEQLRAHGLASHWPCAMIEHGTTVQQRVITGTLATLPALVEQAGLTGPSLLIVGEVVQLRDKLTWDFAATDHAPGTVSAGS
ncbi:siroheme synthase CysG [Sinimarinibacterium sp. NLF-5-8]|uniref:siroheme synthase CysG n=1 Tax=Sinimarinibacterium sp. NLF-5-8 TaxID=2698684 RepID=UPI00137BA6B6|nr:siroheme synthase CysG [Sinimarinibacterium sp. NLF-5-8]QHS09854.1 uroporphyrinogen-III C-methyltransferase [Sinimarinibacterium sp. NLF-5-8]